ncbi:Mitochondrial inner membrane translocase subunit Tim17/Tim22/Tim23/peroxisomal protein PMP24 [Corchorus olitorius]|uniref:Mitochondrial inner membrane translocase subunit Tim17/Tim22/Tim23/peroxisomal protein PMP24 n=1 Tax=Corchorus olitorius TaxID=93759 RepID=A0A1R3K2P1_9ROSI|nr:Mitochondrial inner membrane translocase subunit Tim17/Tim22/Tim23/peroxisomal protein PMP24 [Corchorus olitorius]
MVYARQKEDPWNSIFADAATGSFLSMRQGLATSARLALFGGVLLALTEGAGIMMNKVLNRPTQYAYNDRRPWSCWSPNGFAGSDRK